MSYEERESGSGLRAGDSIAGPVADLLEAASQLLGSKPPTVASALAVTVLLTAEPSEAMAVWHYCKQLAGRRGLRASAVLKGQSLNLRFRHPEYTPSERPGANQSRS